MSAGATGHDTATGAVTRERGALCIVGAGIAGLNALFAASRYLTPADRVVLVDRNLAAGGMWTQTYDYVRLHQPHRMFTAGNIDWQPVRPPAYLATKAEVLRHIAACLRQLRERVTLVEYYGYELETVAESADSVVLRCRARESGQAPLEVTVQRCIKAFGFRVPKNPALPLTSALVTSISPGDETFDAQLADNADRPVYVVGGGKTGMDTAYLLITRYPAREVNLIVGRGTIFASRDKSFPAGLRRWWGNPTTLGYFLDLCSRYDGNNAPAVFEEFKSARAVHLPGTGAQYMFGILSQAENDRIAAGMNDCINDYLDDVVDTPQGPEIVFRSGLRRALPRGAIVVNCTGYVMRQDFPYEPFLSAGGRVVSIQPTSGIHFLTTFAAYFLVHLFFLGELGRLPIYEMDYQALLRKDKVAFPFAAMTQVLYNIIVIMEAVPGRVMTECGLDFDRWYPLHRRLFGLMKLKRHAPAYRAQFRATLDTIARTYGIRCGPLARKDR